jgi:hypothetical protein
MKTIIQNKTTYRVGQSAEENWAIILKAAKDHWWVHLDGVPSSHIILEIDDPLDDELVFAGELCKEQTRYTRPNCRCVATPVGNLRLGSKAGEVLFRKEAAVRYFTA